MIVATLDTPQKRYKQNNKHWLIAKCDNCSKIFIIKKCVKAALNNKRHMHNRECSLQAFGSGIVRNDINRKLKDEYGVNNIAARPDVRAKIIQTCIDKHGVDHVFKAKEVNDKRRATYEKRYGVGWVSQAPEMIERQRTTIYARSNERKEEIESKKHITRLSRTDEEKLLFRFKREATCRKLYGVSHVSQRPEHKLRANSPEACAKRHETMKRNGTYHKSKPEDLLYTMLCEMFSAVQRQVAVVANAHWSIDFYITDIDTYVQFDGEYWHGLDRPIEAIAERKTKRDANIHNKWLTDRTQDTWFAANSKRLVRITDKEFRALGIAVLNKLQVSTEAPGSPEGTQ